MKGLTDGKISGGKQGIKGVILRSPQTGRYQGVNRGYKE